MTARDASAERSALADEVLLADELGWKRGSGLAPPALVRVVGIVRPFSHPDKSAMG